MPNEKRRKKFTLASKIDELGKDIYHSKRNRKYRFPDRATSLVVGMLGHLSRGTEVWEKRGEIPLVPRKIKTVAELYDFSEQEILMGFVEYGSKTFQKLNEILGEYGLPPIKLPPEYIPDP